MSEKRYLKRKPSDSYAAEPLPYSSRSVYPPEPLRLRTLLTRFQKYAARYWNDLSISSLVVWCFGFVLLIAILILTTSILHELNSDTERCLGNYCLEQICDQVARGLVTGTLCYEMCTRRDIDLPKCSSSKFRMPSKAKSGYKIYTYSYIDASFLCPLEPSRSLILAEGLTRDQVHTRLAQMIEARLNYTPRVDQILERLVDFADVNRDGQMSYAEAAALASLLANRHTFFMLTLADKPYMPQVQSFCGSLVRVEQLKSSVISKDFGFFEDKFNLLKWTQRCKIALGILEFFMDASSFNPNDEYGSSSLLLCSPIATSFSYDYVNEAKLANMHELYTSGELVAYLNNGSRHCLSDADCVYNEQCELRCDTTAHQCTHHLVRPQLVHYCRFVKEFVTFETDVGGNLTTKLNALLDRCERLETVYQMPDAASAAAAAAGGSLLADNAKLPVDFVKHKAWLRQQAEWQRTFELIETAGELSELLWDQVKFIKDPPAKKKVKSKSN